MVAPEGWRGALPSPTARAGPRAGASQIESDWGLKTLYNVIAKIPGAESPDEWIVRGNHRDGWTFGAWDPLSGHVAEMAEAKAIGALLKSGWRRGGRSCTRAGTARSGLLGSTEWAEAHAEDCGRKP